METNTTNKELTMTTKRINVTTTAYEGDQDFPEAEHYPEYVAERLSGLYGAEVECSVGGSTRVSLYGFDEDVDWRDVESEIADDVKHGFWDEFCADGYKAYSVQS